MLKNKHFIQVCILFLIAGLLEGVVFFNYNKLAAEPIVINAWLEISPVYNENGSWFHGKIGIGYIRWLLLLESAVIIILEFYLFRYIDVMRYFFQVNSLGLYALNFGIATGLYRLFTGIRGVFVLDYLYIKGLGTYDFPDLYLLICLLGACLWMIPAMIAYYKYRRIKVKGMTFGQKLLWEFKFTGLVSKAAILPRKKWQEMFAAWK